MISSIIDLVLLAALAGTSGCVLLMYRRLQRFDALQGQAAREFARSSEALDKAREAIARLQAEGGQLTVSLANRLNEARLVMNDIEEATTRTSAAFAATQAATQTATPAARQGPPRQARSSAAHTAAQAGDPAPGRHEAQSPRQPAAAGGAAADDGPVATASHTAEAPHPSADVAAPPSAAQRIRVAAGVASPSAETRSHAAAEHPAEDAAPRESCGPAPGGAGDPAGDGDARPDAPGRPGDERHRVPWAGGRWTGGAPAAQPVMSRWAAAAAKTRQQQARPAVRTVNWTQIARTAPGA